MLSTGTPCTATYSAHVNEGVDDRSIDDVFYEREVRMLELAFEGQMHFGIYYAYVKLKEQEVRNLVWISECIVQQQKDEINKFVPCFSKSAPWMSQTNFSVSATCNITSAACVTRPQSSPHPSRRRRWGAQLVVTCMRLPP